MTGNHPSLPVHTLGNVTRVRTTSLGTVAYEAPAASVLRKNTLNMRTTLVLDALRMALGLRAPGPDVTLVHHSDAGSTPVSTTRNS